MSERNDFAETPVADICVYADRTQVGNLVFITADNFKKYIPIEWIMEYAETISYFDEVIYDMLEDWRKEK